MDEAGVECRIVGPLAYVEVGEVDEVGVVRSEGLKWPRREVAWMRSLVVYLESDAACLPYKEHQDSQSPPRSSVETIQRTE